MAGAKKVLDSDKAMTDYRKVFRSVGFPIVLDYASRHNGGEVHIVLYATSSRVGMVLFHDEFDPACVPMFWDTSDEFNYLNLIATQTYWLNESLNFCLPGKCEQFWGGTRVGREIPLLVSKFLSAFFNLITEQTIIS